MGRFSLMAVGVDAASRSAGPLPDSDTVRRTADQVLSRPHFALDAQPEPGHSIMDLILRMIRAVMAAILEAFSWLRSISPVLAWLFIAALVISLLLVVGHIIFTLIDTLRRRRKIRAGVYEIKPSKLDPAELAQLAFAAADRGDYISGVRYLFQSCLAILEQAEGKPFRIGATNREHLNRFRSTPIYEWLGQLVSTIDLKWYGHEPCLAADYGACREAYERICLMATNGRDAQHS